MALFAVLEDRGRRATGRSTTHDGKRSLGGSGLRRARSEVARAAGRSGRLPHGNVRGGHRGPGPRAIVRPVTCCSAQALPPAGVSVPADFRPVMPPARSRTRPTSAGGFVDRARPRRPRPGRLASDPGCRQDQELRRTSSSWTCRSSLMASVAVSVAVPEVVPERRPPRPSSSPDPPQVPSVGNGWRVFPRTGDDGDVPRSRTPGRRAACSPRISRRGCVAGAGGVGTRHASDPQEGVEAWNPWRRRTPGGGWPGSRRLRGLLAGLSPPPPSSRAPSHLSVGSPRRLARPQARPRPRSCRTRLGRARGAVSGAVLAPCCPAAGLAGGATGPPRP